MELIHTWKDYTCEPELIILSYISILRYAIKDIDQLIYAVENNEYKIDKCFNSFHIYTTKGNELVDTVKTIPILQNIGIASLIPPLDIYLAIEEYFSIQESNKERTESVGLTDTEKVTSHGFDEKISFRGKP